MIELNDWFPEKKKVMVLMGNCLVPLSSIQFKIVPTSVNFRMKTKTEQQTVFDPS